MVRKDSIPAFHPPEVINKIAIKKGNAMTARVKLIANGECERLRRE